MRYAYGLKTLPNRSRFQDLGLLPAVAPNNERKAST
jgi:hypothetical protein